MDGADELNGGDDEAERVSFAFSAIVCRAHTHSRAEMKYGT